MQEKSLSELFLFYEIIRLKATNYEFIETMFDYDIFYKKAACVYAIEKKETIDILDDDVKKELYFFVKDKCRYEILNTFMQTFVNGLVNKVIISDVEIDDTDLFMVNNIKSLTDILLIHYKDCLLSQHLTDCNLSKICKSDKEKLVEEFLISVDPTKEWLDIYQSAKKSGNIIYLNECDEAERKYWVDRFSLNTEASMNSCIKSSDGVYVFLNSTNTIEDVRTTIHELSHYISLIKNKGPMQRSLQEFFSTFYELYFISFLEEKEFVQDQLLYLKTFRNIHTSNVIKTLNKILRYVKLYLDNGVITEEIDIAKNTEMFGKMYDIFSKEEIDMLQSVFKNINFQNIDVKKHTHAMCDSCLEEFINYCYLLYTFYYYAIGDYLATKALATLKDGKNILPDIKYFTENSSVDPIEVFKIVGCDVDKLGLVGATESDKSGQKVYSLF